MNYNELDWMKRHNNKYAVRQAGILVRRSFETREEAEEWAKCNYRTDNWRTERLSVRSDQ